MNRLVRFNLWRPALHLSYGHRNSSGVATDWQECYKLLDVSANCTLSEVREAYIGKAKQYHPDGGSGTADAVKFASVERAYRILRKKLSQQSDGPEECEEEEVEKDFDIRHTAPQHRQYLNFDGVGYGNPSQRQSQYQQYKVSRAVDAVHERRIEKLAAETEDRVTFRNKQESKKHIISNAIDRLAEDLIQQSMAKGEFDNLKGIGKPLESVSYNPFLDTVTQKLNEILMNEGFQPEWISMQKEIRTDITKIKNQLEKQRAKFGPAPLTVKETSQWNDYLSKLKDDVKGINVKIDSYNLKVPILNKQMVHFSLEKEAKKWVKDEPSRIIQQSAISREI